MSRPTFLAFFGLVVAAFAVAACTTPPPAPAAPTAAATTAPAPQAPASPTAPPKAAVPSGKLTYLYTPMPSSLDPHNNAGAANGHFLRTIYDTLTELGPGGASVVPALAESWRNVDPTTWELKLRREARFAGGQPVDAETVKYNIERILNPANRLQITALPIGAANYREVRVIAPDTVQIVTPAPDPILPRKLMLFMMIPRDSAETIGANANGTGAFKVRSYTPNQSIVLEPNPASWRGAPRLAEVEFRHVPDPAVRKAALQTGEADLTTLSADLTADLKANRDFRVVADLGAAAIALEMFPADTEGPLKDRRVRQAVQLALNPRQLLDGLFRGEGEVAQSQLYDRRVNGFDPDLRAPATDLARARQLLTEAGFPNGFEAKLQIIPTSNTIGSDLGQGIAGQLSAVGIRISLDPVDFGTYTQRLLNGGQPDMVLGVWEFNSTMDASTPLTNYVYTGRYPQRRFNNEQFNTLFRQAAIEFNEDRRRDLLRRAARILAEEQATGFLFQTNTQFVMRARVEGFTANPDLNYRWYNLSVSR